MPQAVALQGTRWFDPGVPNHLRRRGVRSLGPLGYAFLSGRAADTHPRVTLIEGDRALASVAGASGHRRRLATWDAVSQSALAAEDLEMLMTAGERWQCNHNLEFFSVFSLVEAIGPTYFQKTPLGWQLQLARTLVVPSKDVLRSCGLSAPQATLLRAGIENSVKQVANDLDTVSNQIPHPIRGTMLRYKHGFTWFPLEYAAVPTDPLGVARMQAATNGFLVWTRQASAMLFDGTLAEIDRALGVAQAIARIDGFVTEMLITQAERPRADWGVALYGSSAGDIAVTALRDVVAEFIRRP